MNDEEQFCPKCKAGMESSEHYQKCTRINQLLNEVFHREAHDRWLNTPRLVWGGKSAQQMIENGAAATVANYLDGLAEGVVM